jgi:hypothetical protein
VSVIPKFAFPKTGDFGWIHHVVRKYQTNLVASFGIVAAVPAGAVDGKVTVTTGSTTLTSTQTFIVHDSWSIGKAMPTARFGAFAGAIGANIYVVGGATNSGYQVTNVNEIYNTQTNTWKTGAPDPTSRELGASAVVNGILFMGDFFRNNVSDVGPRTAERMYSS